MRKTTSSKTMLAFSRRQFGALTSKPYAFVARPWELQSVNAIDNFNSLGANIQLQTRGNDLMRVLPRTNDEINGDYIDDKTRFCYDGLKLQRLVKPLCRDIENPSIWDKNTFNWRDVLGRVANGFRELGDPKTSKLKFRGIVGPTSDLYSALALTDFAEMVDADEFATSVEMLGTQMSKFASDPSTYRFNSTLLGVEKSDLCLLVGTFMEIDNPLYAYRMLQNFRKDTFRLVQLGPDNELRFPIESLGLSLKVLEDIANEVHPFFKVLRDAEYPMIILDQSIFKREDVSAVLKAVDTLCEKTNLRKTSESGEVMWDGVNVFHRNVNDVGLLDLGRLKDYTVDPFDTDVLFLMNVYAEDLPRRSHDVSRLAESAKFIIYQGSHGDELAGIADVVLPGACFTEKSGIYTNVEGRAQLSHRALTPPGVGKNDWAVIRAISEVVGMQLPYDTEEEIQARLESLVPATEYSNLGDIQALDFFPQGEKSYEVTEISDQPFVRTNCDFFLDGHVVPRMSKVMAACSKDTNEKFRTFIH